MSNSCSNTITLYGTREALAEIMMMISELPEFSYGRAQDGSAFVSPLCNTEATTAERIPPGYRRDVLVPELYIPNPLRYEGGGPEGWSAPLQVAHYGFDLCLTGAEIPDKMIDAFDADAGELPVLKLGLRCDTKWSPPIGVLRAMSARHPSVVVECRYEELGNGVLGAIALRAGAIVAQHDCTNNVTRADCGLDEDSDDESMDDSEVASEKMSMRFQELGHREMDSNVSEVAMDQALTKLDRMERWSGLTRAAYESGVAGLTIALNLAARGAPGLNLAAQLATDIAESRRRGGPSWIDACLHRCEEFEAFATLAMATPGDEVEETDPIPLSGPGTARALELLELCALDTPLAAALVLVLSEPSARLMSSLHPVCVLVDAAKEHGDGPVHAGLTRIVDAMKQALAPIEEAGLVGREFLVHKTADSEGMDFAASLVINALLENGAEGLATIKKTFGVGALHERGPKMNPTFRYDPVADALLLSLMHCGLQGTVMGTELALHAGFDPELLFHSQARIHPRSALLTFAAIRGDVGHLTPTMASRLLECCGVLKDTETVRVYLALKAECDMRGAIAAAAGPDEPPPSVRKRARHGV